MIVRAADPCEPDKLSQLLVALWLFESGASVTIEVAQKILPLIADATRRLEVLCVACEHADKHQKSATWLMEAD